MEISLRRLGPFECPCTAWVPSFEADSLVRNQKYSCRRLSIKGFPNDSPLPRQAGARLSRAVVGTKFAMLSVVKNVEFCSSFFANADKHRV
jgi:hypothetical protein